MSEGMNKVLLLGNLGADPELRSTQGGESVLRLRLATAERYQDKQQQWQDRTEWHNVTVWGKRAEGLHKILAKGSQICVEGALRTSSYEKDGQKIWKTEIVARAIYLCGGGAKKEGGAKRDDAPAGDPFDSGSDFGGL